MRADNGADVFDGDIAEARDQGLHLFLEQLGVLGHVGMQDDGIGLGGIIDVLGGFIGQVGNGAVASAHLIHADHQAVAALDAADRACEARPQGFALVVKSQLFMFLHALYCNRHTGLVRPLVEEAEWLKGVIAYVKAHYAERITVADAAAVSGYSPSHFMRIFRQEAGQTFVDFLTDYRLSAAVYYLKETRDEIGVVAENCGFANLSYFIRRFNRK